MQSRDEFAWGAALQIVLTVAFFVWLLLGWRNLKKLGIAPEPVVDGQADEPYRVFTSKYDQELGATDVPKKLMVISPDAGKGWLKAGRDSWTLIADKAETDFRAAQFPEGQLSGSMEDVAITLLIDHSGSMKGDPILWTAGAVRRLTEIWTACGAKVEVLGFSTAGWQGGFARQAWLAAKRPKRPGRLCALLHIIYKSADCAEFDNESWRVMLNSNLLRENVDGEALEWAERRLLLRPERQKMLMVLSDGAPVDDSTLMENGPSYLVRHLKSVIERLQSNNHLILGAVGLNYRVSDYYKLSTAVNSADELMPAMLDLVVVMKASSLSACHSE